MNFSMRNRLMATTMVGGAFAAALVSAAAAMADDAPVQEIVVTGSRLKTTNATTISPVTVVGSADIKASGVVNVEDLLNALPQVFADQGGSVSNGATGTATVNLRGQGCQRTLVLIDGKRLAGGDGGYLCADLNFVPAALIDHVDILTGGAASTYGADAVAGVVNFTMLKNFQGVKLDVQEGTYEHHNDNTGLDGVIAAKAAINPAQFQEPKSTVWDGRKTTASIVVGGQTNDGKGGLEGYVTYTQISQIIQRDRDYSACTLGASGSYFACGGSSTAATGRFYVLDPNNPTLTTTNSAGQPVLCCSGTSFTLNPSSAGTFRNYSSSRDAFNYGAYNYYQRPDERYNAGVFAHYEINSHAELYSQFMFMDDYTQAQIAPSGAFFGGSPSPNGDYLLPCSDALFSASQQKALCGTNNGATNNTPGYADLYIGKRNVEGGTRDYNIRHTDYRIVEGVKGDVIDGWTYDVSAQFTRVITQNYTAGELSLSRVANALNVVSVGGKLTCESVVNGSDPNCVPWNIFTPGGVTQAALNYIQVPVTFTNTVSEQIVNASVTGDLGKYGIKSPWAKDAAQINFGVEYRRETASTSYDEEDLSGDQSDLGGHGVQDTSGSYNVSEEFFEAQLPLIQNMPFVNTLNLVLGGRESDYNLSGEQGSWKVGLVYAPEKEFRLRYTFQDAIRAPNVNELYSPNSYSLTSSFSDPCAYTPNLTAAQTAALQTACLRTGLTAAQFAAEQASGAAGSSLLASPAQQYNDIVGGNAKLQPEQAATNSFGFTWNPKAGAELSIDWWDIKIDNIIQPLNPAASISSCFTGQSTATCADIHRDPSTGSLWTGTGYVLATNANVGSQHTRGIDVDGSYRWVLPKVAGADLGSLKAHVTGTFLMMLKSAPGQGAAAYDCRSQFGLECGSPNPVWRHRATLNWNTPWKVTATATWRYFSGVKDDTQADIESLGGAIPLVDQKIKEQSYFDLSASWRVTDRLTARLGMDNIFDKAPPVVSDDVGGSGYNGNTFSQVYDTYGRYIFAGLSAEF